MEINRKDRNAVIALNLVQGFGPRSFRKVLDRCDPIRNIFSMKDDFLTGCGLRGEVISNLRKTRPESMAAKEKEKAARAGISIVTYLDEIYPVMLKHIHDPPPVLYQMGPIDFQKLVSVAVVGSRRPTPYGLTVAEDIGRGLAGRGFNVVSGLARGIDTAAHRGALDCDGTTTAVYGSGLDIIYPRENRSLVERILKRGACLSEFPISTQPERLTFPRRNRIISGLSLATVVVEAGEKSGALITAEFALEQGREVFAVPGPISSRNSAGCHRLIKEGAHLFDSIDDLVAELAPFIESNPPMKTVDSGSEQACLSEEESAVLSFFKGEPLFLDELINYSGLPPQKAASLILSLELKGRVRQFPGKRYVRISEGT